MNEELPLNDKPRWSVVPILGRDPKLEGKRKKKGEQPIVIRHDLRYGTRKILSAETEKEVERLREMAKLFNSKGSEPRDLKSDGLVQLHLMEVPNSYRPARTK